MIPSFDTVQNQWIFIDSLASGFFTNGYFVSGTKLLVNAIADALDNGKFYFYNTSVPDICNGVYINTYDYPSHKFGDYYFNNGDRRKDNIYTPVLSQTNKLYYTVVRGVPKLAGNTHLYKNSGKHIGCYINGIFSEGKKALCMGSVVINLEEYKNTITVNRFIVGSVDNSELSFTLQTGASSVITGPISGVMTTLSFVSTSVELTGLSLSYNYTLTISPSVGYTDPHSIITLNVCMSTLGINYQLPNGTWHHYNSSDVIDTTQSIDIFCKSEEDGKFVYYKGSNVLPLTSNEFYTIASSNVYPFVYTSLLSLSTLSVSSSVYISEPKYISEYFSDVKTIAAVSSMPVFIPTRAFNSNLFYTFSTRVVMNDIDKASGINSLISLHNDPALDNNGVSLCNGYYSYTHKLYISGIEVPFNYTYTVSGKDTLSPFNDSILFSDSTDNHAWSEGVVLLDMSKIQFETCQYSEAVFYMRHDTGVSQATGVQYDMLLGGIKNKKDQQLVSKNGSHHVLYYNNGIISPPPLNSVITRTNNNGVISFKRVDQAFKGPYDRWYMWPSSASLAVTGDYNYMSWTEQDVVNYYNGTSMVPYGEFDRNKSNYNISKDSAAAGLYDDNKYISVIDGHSNSRLYQLVLDEPFLNRKDNLVYTTDASGKMYLYNTITPINKVFLTIGNSVYIDNYARYYTCNNGVLSLFHGTLNNITYQKGSQKRVSTFFTLTGGYCSNIDGYPAPQNLVVYAYTRDIDVNTQLFTKTNGVITPAIWDSSIFNAAAYGQQFMYNETIYQLNGKGKVIDIIGKNTHYYHLTGSVCCNIRSLLPLENIVVLSEVNTITIGTQLYSSDNYYYTPDVAIWNSETRNESAGGQRFVHNGTSFQLNGSGVVVAVLGACPVLYKITGTRRCMYLNYPDNRDITVLSTTGGVTVSSQFYTLSSYDVELPPKASWDSTEVEDTQSKGQQFVYRNKLYTLNGSGLVLSSTLC